MKRKYLLLAALFLLPWFSPASPVQIRSSGKNIQVSFTLGQWQLGTETVATSSTQTTTFQTIEMLTEEEEYGIWADEGYPELPQLTVYLSVPQTATACHVTDVPSSVSQRALTRKILPYCDGSEDEALMYIPNAAYYSGNETPLTAIYEVSEIYEVMGQKAVALTIYPFTYIPAQNKLYVINTATFTLNFDENSSSVPQPVEATEARVSYLSSYFSNFNVPKGNVKKGNYLIITTKEFKNALSVFAAYKNTLGYNTSIVTTEETGKTAKEINQYIDNLPSVQRPTFILLAGDVNRIPANEGTHYATSDGDPLTDQSYRKHTDEKRVYGDYFVGRWPISTEAQAVSIINRTMAMEKAYATVTPQAVTIKGSAGNDEKMGERFDKCYEAIKKRLGDRGYTIYEPHVTQNNIIQNEKIKMIIYVGHGLIGLWDVSHQTGGGGYSPSNFTYNMFSPILWGFSCSTGFYEDGDKKNSRFPTSIVCDNGPISYFGPSILIRAQQLKFIVRGVMRGFKDREQLGTAIHRGMDKYRNDAHSRFSVKWSNRMMQAFNLMGDPSFVLDGVSTKPANIVFDGDYTLVNGISTVFEATDTIEISGNFVVKNGASLTLKAGGEVILGSDFKVEEGGELCVIVE